MKPSCAVGPENLTDRRSDGHVVPGVSACLDVVCGPTSVLFINDVRASNILYSFHL